MKNNASGRRDTTPRIVETLEQLTIPTRNRNRAFSFISKNGRGRPLLDMATVVNLIGNTKTQAGLEVRCVVDEGSYAKGIKISDKELASFNITKHAFHGEGNYTIKCAE